MKFEKYHGKIHSPVASDADCGLKMWCVSITESFDAAESFIGRVDIKYGTASHIDYYRTHPQFGGKIYYHYYPSTISCSVQRTLPTETGYRSEVLRCMKMSRFKMNDVDIFNWFGILLLQIRI